MIFSGSLPATRVAVMQFDPVFLTVARAAIAGALALCLLLAAKEKRPAHRDVASLVVVASGVVVGFPLLTAFALQQVTSAHSIVFVRSEEHTSELQSLMRISYAVFSLQKKNK